MLTAWHSTGGHLQQAMAATQELRKRAADGAHQDVAARERSAMCCAAEHMLYMLRQQQAAIAEASRVAPRLDQLCNALHAALGGAAGTQQRHATSAEECAPSR